MNLSAQVRIIIEEDRTCRLAHATEDVNSTPAVSGGNPRIRAALEHRCIHVAMFFAIRAPRSSDILQDSVASQPIHIQVNGDLMIPAMLRCKYVRALQRLKIALLSVVCVCGQGQATHRRGTAQKLAESKWRGDNDGTQRGIRAIVGERNFGESSVAGVDQLLRIVCWRSCVLVVTSVMTR